MGFVIASVVQRSVAIYTIDDEILHFVQNDNLELNTVTATINYIDCHAPLHYARNDKPESYEVMTKHKSEANGIERCGV